MSVSRVQLQIDGAVVAVNWRMQVQTLLEVPVLELDRDHDAQISENELRAAWPRLKVYLEDGLLLSPGSEIGNFKIAGWQRLNEEFDWLSVHGTIEFDARPQALQVATSVFFDEGNPDHRMDISVSGLRTTEMSVLLSSDRREWTFEAPAAFGDYLGFGFHHVLGGYDHLAFLLALLFGVAGGAALVAAVTAFTLAHSLTLVCSALGWLSLSPSLVEPGIALSIVLTLWWHRRGKSNYPWQPALGFGLLHGFGFAGVLGEIGLPSAAKASALFSFNLGVELGQLSFILPVAGGVWLLRRLLNREQQQNAVRLAAIALGAFGLKVFAELILANSTAGAPYMLLAALIPSILATAAAPKCFRDIAQSWLLYVIFVCGQSAASWMN